MNFNIPNNGNNEKTPIARNQIGFKTKQDKQSKPLLQHKKTPITNTVFIRDKHTIEHNGKRYTLNDVNNFINIYTKRVKEATEKGKIVLSHSRAKTLEYWKGRKSELLNKLQIINYGQ